MISDSKHQVIEWKSEFSVNLEFLDNHHKKFLDIINELKNTLSQQSCSSDLSLIFIKLIHYTENFFQEEEIYFKQLDYPNFKYHKDHHNQFIQKLKAFHEGFSLGKEGVCCELLTMLEDFFEVHILGYDREAVDFLQKKGVK
jgi:hemerythrin-like metal-binding protein